MQIGVHSRVTQQGVDRVVVSFSYATCRWESDETLMRHWWDTLSLNIAATTLSFPASLFLSSLSHLLLPPPLLMNTQFMLGLSLHRNAISHSAKLKANLLAVCRKFSSCFPPWALHAVHALFRCRTAAACHWRMTLLTFPFKPSANITHTPRCLRIRFWIFEMCINFVTGSTKSYICQKAGKNSECSEATWLVDTLTKSISLNGIVDNKENPSVNFGFSMTSMTNSVES